MKTYLKTFNNHQEANNVIKDNQFLREAGRIEENGLVILTILDLN